MNFTKVYAVYPGSFFFVDPPFTPVHLDLDSDRF